METDVYGGYKGSPMSAMEYLFQAPHGTSKQYDPATGQVQVGKPDYIEGGSLFLKSYEDGINMFATFINQLAVPITMQVTESELNNSQRPNNGVPVTLQYHKWDEEKR